MARPSRRGPLIPPERLRPPESDWLERLLPRPDEAAAPEVPDAGGEAPASDAAPKPAAAMEEPPEPTSGAEPAALADGTAAQEPVFSEPVSREPEPEPSGGEEETAPVSTTERPATASEPERVTGADAVVGEEPGRSSAEATSPVAADARDRTADPIPGVEDDWSGAADGAELTGMPGGTRMEGAPPPEELGPAEQAAPPGELGPAEQPAPPEEQASSAEVPPPSGLDERATAVVGAASPPPPAPAPARRPDRPVATLLPSGSRSRPGAPRPDGRVVASTIIGVLVAACVLLVILNVQRIADTQAEASRQAATYSPPALQASGTPETRLVTVLGEDSSGDEAAPSTTLLAKGLDGATVSVHTAAALRYVAGGDDRRTFERLAASVDPDSDVVVLFGGANDQDDGLLSLATAATRAIRAVEARAPGATVVVVGPLWTSTATPPDSLLQVRTTLRAAAKSAVARFIDPIDARWLRGEPGVVDDAGHLTEAGRKELARRLAQAVAPELP